VAERFPCDELFVDELNRREQAGQPASSTS
jgi:hypothetical protein